MAKKKETAEQKLRKMIESGSAQPSSSSGRQIVQKQTALTAVRTLNKLLILGLIGSLAFLVYQVKLGQDAMAQNVSFSVKDTIKRSVNTEDLIPNVQRLSFYLAAVNERNIFAPYQDKTVSTVVKSSNENSRVTKRLDKYKLVGISWFDRVDTASAMIEDTDKNVTYFVQKGERLDNITIKTIYADSVELAYENEEIILGYDKSKM